MREKLLKVAVAAGIASLLPFFLLILRRESPPPPVKIKASHEQSIGNFTLEQVERGKKWVLKSPSAKFKGDEVFLEKPLLTVKVRGRTFRISAKRAIYNRRTENSRLYSVVVRGRDFEARSESGTFYSKTAVFRSRSRCSFTFSSSYTVRGRGCRIDFNRERVIIFSNVKTVIKGVGK